jgi:polysaccharide pyruvyl transferase WcaK-like protein
MKIFIRGYYGHKNLGDELILEILVSQLRRMFGNSVHITVATSEDSSKLYNRLKVFQYKSLKRDLKRSDIIIFGGGGLFDDVGKREWRDQWNLLKIMFLIKLFCKKMFFYGVGYGNIRTKLGKIIINLQAILADGIFVRSSNSYKKVISMWFVHKKKVFEMRDLVYSLKDCKDVEYGIKIKNSGKVSKKNIVIGVNVFDYYGFLHSDEARQALFRKYFVQNLDDLIQKLRCEIRFIPCQGLFDGDDKLEALKILSLMKYKQKCKICSYTSHWDIVREISKVDLMVSMKLHGSIVGSIFGKKLVGIFYHEKVRNLFSDMKLDKYCLPIERLGENNLCDLIINCWRDDGVLNRINSYVLQAYTLNQRAMSIFKKFVGILK